MVRQEDRISMGGSVRDRAVHYYMGLTGNSNEEAAKETFKYGMSSDHSLIASAPRLAEHEIPHKYLVKELYPLFFQFHFS